GCAFAAHRASSAARFSGPVGGVIERPYRHVPPTSPPPRIVASALCSFGPLPDSGRVEPCQNAVHVTSVIIGLPVIVRSGSELLRECSSDLLGRSPGYGVSLLNAREKCRIAAPQNFLKEL